MPQLNSHMGDRKLTKNTQKTPGNFPSDVIQALNRRKEEAYIAGSMSDKFRIGLVIEGGAMRGTVSSAAADALYQLGYGPCFDAVYGTSSGALNAAYFVSGQITIGTTIYYENATDPQFINLFRWPDPLDINWLIDNWISHGKPLNLEQVMSSRTDLYISITDTDTGAVRYVSNRTDSVQEIIPSLRASCSTPMFVTHQETIGGHTYNDGMLQAGIPVQKAIDDGCTHVVAILTRPNGYRKKKSKLIAFIENIRLRKYSRSYLDSYHARHEIYNHCLDILYTPVSGLKTLVIAPDSGDFLIGNSENKPDPLKRAARESMDRVTDVFGAPHDSVKMYGEI